MQIYDLILCFFLYGFLGWCVEVAYASAMERRFVNRGFLNGPICPIYGVGVSAVVFLLEPWKKSWVLLYAASVVLVTVIEGITGFAMDKIFHHKWWDYSKIPFNIGGYVCLTFSLMWGVACLIIVKGIHPLIYKGLELLPLPVGVALIIVLSGILIADICVTVSGVLKLNRRLETMSRIARDMREFSDILGNSIHENVMGTLEKLEGVSGEIREKFEGAAEERRQKILELRARYMELAKTHTKVSDRLMKAFPKMESRKYGNVLQDILNEIRKRK